MSALLDQAAVAKRYGKARATVRRWTALGILPTFVDPDSGRVYYPEAALIEWEKSFFHAEHRAAS